MGSHFCAARQYAGADPGILVWGGGFESGSGLLPQKILKSQMLSDEFRSIFRLRYNTMILQVLSPVSSSRPVPRYGFWGGGRRGAFQKKF